MNVLKRIGLAGLVPVVVLDNAGDAVPAAEALLAGGLDIMEITMRTDAGIQAIKNVAERCPDMLVGAGTVLSLEACQQAVHAGAKFIVSPGFNEKVVAWCVEKDVPVTPGCVTPTEIETALAYGIKVVKFFPAGIYGGVRACKALYDPYRAAGISFIPTGGINNENLSEYADKPYIHAVGGSWLCRSSDIAKHDFSAVTNSASEAIDVLLGFELAQVSINQEDEDGSVELADRLNRAFKFPIKSGNRTNFIGTGFNGMHAPYSGAHGHIGIRTHSIQRAVYYLKKRGFEVDDRTAKFKIENISEVCLNETFGGFAVHLLEK